MGPCLSLCRLPPEAVIAWASARCACGELPSPVLISSSLATAGEQRRRQLSDTNDARSAPEAGWLQKPRPLANRDRRRDTHPPPPSSLYLAGVLHSARSQSGTLDGTTLGWHALLADLAAGRWPLYTVMHLASHCCSIFRSGPTPITRPHRPVYPDPPAIASPTHA